MIDRVDRELEIPASPEEVWDAITGDGWLADEVRLELRPGGDAEFRSRETVKTGWVEEASAPERLVFWWSSADEPATRVELKLERRADGATRLSVSEARPLEILDLVGIPLSGSGGRSYGPSLLAVAC